MLLSLNHSSIARIAEEDSIKFVFFTLTKFPDSKSQWNILKFGFTLILSGSNVTVATKQREQRENKTKSSLRRSSRSPDSDPTSRLGSTTSWGRRRLTPAMFISESCSLGTSRSKSSRGWNKGEINKIVKTVSIFYENLCRYVDTGEMMNDFPYRARAMFAFEEQDGVDVCFFGMHVQVSVITNNKDKQFINGSIRRNMEASVPSPTPEESMWPIWTRFISSNQDISELQFIMKYCWVCT